MLGNFLGLLHIVCKQSYFYCIFQKSKKRSCTVETEEGLIISKIGMNKKKKFLTINLITSLIIYFTIVLNNKLNKISLGTKIDWTSGQGHS